MHSSSPVLIFYLITDGTELVRYYTPVIPSLLHDTTDCPNVDTNSSSLHFLIKTYPEGLFTSKLNHFSDGKSVQIGDTAGSFNASVKLNVQNVIAVAAGTGITPMIRIIVNCLTSSQDKKVWLLFFNRQTKDIIWHTEWDILSQKYPDRLKIWHILSDPEADWTGLSGRVNQSILDETVKPLISSSSLICVCGPTEFTTETLRYK